MARYFAQLDENKIVQRVIVCDSLEWCVNNLGGEWVETFMDNPNKNYAGKGYKHHADKDNFSCEQPHPSWVLGDDCKWKAPKDKPVYDNKKETIYWNESKLDWDIVARPGFNEQI